MSTALTTTQQQLPAIAKAIRQSPVILHVSTQDIAEVLNISIAKAYIDYGSTKRPEQYEFNALVSELAIYLQTPFKYVALRINEIPIAINNGVLGEYGEFYGLSKATFVKFIKSYYTSPERHRYWAELQNEKEQVKSIVPDLIKQFRIAAANTIETYNHHKSGQPLGTRGVIAYDFLNDLGVIQYDKADKIKIMHRARELVIAEKGKEVFNADMFTRLALQKSLDDLKDGSQTDKDHGAIISKAKILTVIRFFDECDNFIPVTDLCTLIEANRDKWIKLKSLPKVEGGLI